MSLRIEYNWTDNLALQRAASRIIEDPNYDVFYIGQTARSRASGREESVYEGVTLPEAKQYALTLFKLIVDLEKEVERRQQGGSL